MGAWSQLGGPWSLLECPQSQLGGLWSQLGGPWSRLEGSLSKLGVPWSQLGGLWSLLRGPESQLGGPWSQLGGPYGAAAQKLDLLFENHSGFCGGYSTDSTQAIKIQL